MANDVVKQVEKKSLAFTIRSRINPTRIILSILNVKKQTVTLTGLLEFTYMDACF